MDELFSKDFKYLYPINMSKTPFTTTTNPAHPLVETTALQAQ